MGKCITVNNDDIVQRYLNKESISDISEIYNCSNSVIRKRLIDNHIEIRQKGKYVTYKKMNNKMIGIITGMLLGDSWFICNRKRKCIGTKHSLSQDAYLLWKFNKLKPIIGGRIYKGSTFDNRTFKTYKYIYYCSNTHPEIDKLYCEFYKTNTKQVTKEILEKLTPEGISIWFCDDGNLYKNLKWYTNQLTISTNAFDNDSLDLIMDMFKYKYDLKFSINKTDKSIRMCNMNGIQKFYTLFGDYIPQCMNYKKLVIV